MDSATVEIFTTAFHSGANFGSSLIPGLVVVSLLVLVGKIIRSEL